MYYYAHFLFKTLEAISTAIPPAAPPARLAPIPFTDSLTACPLDPLVIVFRNCTKECQLKPVIIGIVIVKIIKKIVS